MHTTSPPGWDAPALAAALQRLRDRQYSVARLADLAQISRPQMSRWSSGGHRPGYDAIRHLAEAVLEEHPNEEYREIVRDLCTAAGYPGVAADLGAAEARPEGPKEMVSPYSGRVWKIVTSLQRRAEEADLSPEEEEAMIMRAIENADRQAEMYLEAELRRRERGEGQT